LPVRRQIIFSEFVRRHSNVPGELACKIILRIVANHAANFDYGNISGYEQSLSLANSPPYQVLRRCVASFLFKNVRNKGLTFFQGLSNVLNVQGLAKIFVDVIHHSPSERSCKFFCHV